MPPRKSSTVTAAIAAPPPPVPIKRNSGGKRTLDEAQSTDVVNIITGTADQRGGVVTHPPQVQQCFTDPQQPPAKKKVTYALPHQNMEEGHFYVVLGEDIDVSTQRFKILSLLGEGTFGKVVEAWDRKRKEYCAVKIVRNIERYTRDAMFEVQFMQHILDRDPTDRFCLSRLLRYFSNDFKHLCVVMPRYGLNMLDHLRKYGPLHHRQLAEVIFHCGAALDFLHSDMRLMHTDLKPENILFEATRSSEQQQQEVPLERGRENPYAAGSVRAPTPSLIRVCDLGGCCDERHSPGSVVSTRHYRSPEVAAPKVILGLGWMFSTDMWSMGCIIYELATGRLLYDTHDNLEHLHLMEKTLAKLPADWAKKCSVECVPLFVKGTDKLRPLPAASATKVARVRAVLEMIPDTALVDLILGCLTYDRSIRLTARQMMTHPFVSTYFPQSLSHPNHPKNRKAMLPSPAM
ncbi:protein kinase, putative [Bodo saltans]|uniref:Protein kinase, putative n=1 Tax=Bodo saltans TaxID=75058 RepID=A0A0S4IVF2_BODSA|nr:protein kinase, putative [Bodo saltans]|eukprot:CUG18279.1 protein kinase, putative [Bodo saltans]